MSESSFSEKNSEDLKTQLTQADREKHINSRDADITLAFLEKYDAEVPEITPEEEKRLSRKVVSIILFLTAFTNLLLYADKATLSYSSIFGMWEDTHMDQNKYNNSSTLFYVGYIVGQVNLILVQKFPLGKLLTITSFC